MLREKRGYQSKRATEGHSCLHQLGSPGGLQRGSPGRWQPALRHAARVQGALGAAAAPARAHGALRLVPGRAAPRPAALSGTGAGCGRPAQRPGQDAGHTGRGCALAGGGDRGYGGQGCQDDGGGAGCGACSDDRASADSAGPGPRDSDAGCASCPHVPPAYCLITCRPPIVRHWQSSGLHTHCAGRLPARCWYAWGRCAPGVAAMPAWGA